MKRLLIIMQPEAQPAAKQFVRDFLEDLGQDNRMAMDTPYSNDEGETLTHYISCTTYSEAVEAALPHLPDTFSSLHPTLPVPELYLCRLDGEGAPTPKAKLKELGLSPYNPTES